MLRNLGIRSQAFCERVKPLVKKFKLGLQSRSYDFDQGVMPSVKELGLQSMSYVFGQLTADWLEPLLCNAKSKSSSFLRFRVRGLG